MNKNNTSPYSKMYMVGPAVYEKLLNCLDEVDKNSTQKLNNSLDNTNQDSTFRPADKYISNLNEQDFDMVNNIETPFLNDVDISKFPDPIPDITSDQSMKESTPIKEKTKLLTCLECNKNYKSQTTLSNHLRKIHNKISDNSIPKNELNELKFKCDICESKFSKENLLTHHQKIFHTKPSGGNIKPTQKFPCNFCDENFDRKIILKKHIKEVHNPTEKNSKIIPPNSGSQEKKGRKKKRCQNPKIFQMDVNIFFL